MATTTTYTDQTQIFPKNICSTNLTFSQWLVDAIPKTQKSFQLSAYLESFTVHLRALIDFLYEQPRWDGDVVAGDFFDFDLARGVPVRFRRSSTTLERA